MQRVTKRSDFDGFYILMNITIYTYLFIQINFLYFYENKNYVKIFDNNKHKTNYD